MTNLYCHWLDGQVTSTKKQIIIIALDTEALWWCLTFPCLTTPFAKLMFLFRQTHYTSKFHQTHVTQMPLGNIYVLNNGLPYPHIWKGNRILRIVIMFENFSVEDGRVLLQMMDGSTCKLEIQPVEIKDGGKWTFTVESGLGETRTFSQYSHNVSVIDDG